MVTFVYLLSGILLWTFPPVGGVIFALAVILHVRENEVIEKNWKNPFYDDVADYIDSRLGEGRFAQPHEEYQEIRYTKDDTEHEERINKALEGIDDPKKKEKWYESGFGRLVWSVFFFFLFISLGSGLVSLISWINAFFTN